MAANLTQQYLKAEREYRVAQTPEDQLRCLESMLREIPKHKGTDKLQAELKAKISRAKQEVESARKSAKKAAAPELKIPRQGAGRVVICGGPNAGKSSLLKCLTRATPEVAPFPFTTREPQPGMLPFEDVSVQLIDTPAVTPDILPANLLELIRGADIVLLLADMGNDDGIDALIGAISALRQTKTRLARASGFDEQEVGVSYTKTLLIFTHMDLPDADERIAMLHELQPLDLPTLRISATTGDGLDELRQAIFQGLEVARVYTKLPQEKEPNYDKPFVVRCGGTLLDVAALVHDDLAANFKHARVWTAGATEPVIAKGDYVVRDKDVVEIHTLKPL